MTKFRTLSIFFLVFAVITLNSCNNDDEENTVSPSILGSSTVYDVVSKNGSLSSLKAALDASGDLSATLKGAGPFTLFAPDNGAFDALATQAGYASAAGLLDSIDPGLLSTILTYHVVAGKNLPGDLTTGKVLTTVEGGELTVNVAVDGDDQTIQILDATKLPETDPVSNVTVGNPDPANGSVYIVDKVLLPQAAIDAFNVDIRPTIADMAASLDNLSTLVSALNKTGLMDTVKDLDTANVLAPTNEAFTILLVALGDDYNSLDDFDNEAELAFLGDILKYHVLPGIMDLTVGPAETALADSSVEVIAGTGGFAFRDATGTDSNTVTANIEAKNGFVQIIDRVLLPQAALDFVALLASNDLATTVADTPELSILEQALVAIDSVDLFVDATNAAPDSTATNFTYFRPVTVFAPTNAAFEDLFTTLGTDYTGIDSFDTDEELALLKEIVLYHVVAGKTLAENLTAGPLVTLLEGNDLEIIAVLGTDGFVIGDASNNVNANITVPDVLARNGVAQIIDKVLLPQGAVDFVNSQNN